MHYEMFVPVFNKNYPNHYFIWIKKIFYDNNFDFDEVSSTHENEMLENQASPRYNTYFLEDKSDDN